ncbi:MAG: hypothetical protein DI534_11525 [Leifsonia xyli]|nr:MAG: hypothetical protein DI534_11525 [Leifsonia xyli]
MSDLAPPPVPQPEPQPATQPEPQPAPQPGPPVTGPDPLRTATPSPWGHAVAAGLALVGIALNVGGGAGFPSSAPVEWIMNAGITIDLVAVLVACGIGFGVSLRQRAVRPALVFPWLGLALALVGFFSWAVMSGGLFETLIFGGRGRYMTDIGGAFYTGVAWTLGAIFSAYGLRGRTRPAPNIAAWVGIGLWALTLIGVVTSALLYAADLTD